MGEKLKILSLRISFMKMVSPTIFLVEEHLHWMVLWKGKIDPCKRCLEHISEFDIQNYFRVEAVSTTYYILNKVSIRKVLIKIHYELWKGLKPSVLDFHIFGCTCYTINNKDKLGKFDKNSDKENFLGYSLSYKAYKIYNLRTWVVEESMHVVFDEYDSTLDKRRISDLEEKLERTRINKHTQNIAPCAYSLKKREEDLFEVA